MFRYTTKISVSWKEPYACQWKKKYFELITEGVYDTSLYGCSILHSPNQDIDVGSGAPGKPETSSVKGASVHIYCMWIKKLCNHKVWDFATAFQVWKLSGTFEKQALGHDTKN